MDPSKKRMPLKKSLRSAENNDRDSGAPPFTDLSQESSFSFTGFNSNSAGLASRQDSPQPIDPLQISALLADFSQYWPPFGGVPSSGLQSPANTSTSDGSVNDFGVLLTPTTLDNNYPIQDALPPTSMPDFTSLFAEIQGPQFLPGNRNQALPTTQSIGTQDVNHQDLLNFNQTDLNNGLMLNSAPNNALLTDYTLLPTQIQDGNLLNNRTPSPPTTESTQADFNTILTGLLGPLTTKVMNHVNHPSHRGNAVEALSYILDGPITTASGSQSEPSTSNTATDDSLFDNAFFQTLMANAALHGQYNTDAQLDARPPAPTLHTPARSLKRSTSTIHPQSSSTSALESVTIGSLPIPPFAKRSRPEHLPIAPASGSDLTVDDLFGINPSLLQGPFNFFQQFLDNNPPEQVEEEVEDEVEEIVDVRHLPITGQLKGAEEWTPATAEGYGKRLSQYINTRTALTTKYIKKLVPPVLNAKEKARKRAEAEKYVENCPIYKDALQSVRTSLFDPTKPDFPQKVKHTAGCFLLFKVNHAANFGGNPNDKWKELKKENGEGYWKWFKKSSDLRDEHLRQTELGYIVFREGAPKIRKQKVAGGFKIKNDHREDTVADEESVDDEGSDSENNDVVG